uniref:B box-type domain-containing protein n=1 Tax=Magallana gigas TaxID=29159 RepID=A0A8W8MTE6_MAGGI
KAMDPRSSAQDVHRCDLCETALVHSYCDFCHVNLCKLCIADHISDGYDKHKIVPFQERRSTLIYPKCGTHPHKNCDLQCKNCNDIFVCSSCTASEIHRGHIFVEVSEVYTTKKNAIADEANKLKNLIYPTYEEITLPTFIPKPLDHEKLYNLFGQITPLSTATEENVLSLNQPNTSVRELLDEPELVATIQTGYEKLRSVTYLNEDCVWTCGLTKDIKCFNIKGVLLHTLSNKSEQRPSDIAVDSDGNLLFSDLKSRTVNKVNNGQTEELIRLQGWTPSKLCVTSNGDLLVTMYSDDETQSKVVRYMGSAEKQAIQFDDEGKPLYSGIRKPKCITENRNYDICVADSGARAIVVVNQNGKLRWRYIGHPSVTKKEPFKPFGITTESQSRILTADCHNHCIHILDQDGQFLRYIDNCDLQNPFGLCVDKNDNLFVSEHFKGNVKKIKFLR